MQTRIHDLIIKFLKGKITTEERVELEHFKARSLEIKKVVEQLTDPLLLLELIRVSKELDVDAAWQRVIGKRPSLKKLPCTRMLLTKKNL
jgi:hypothetical protein